MIDMMIGIDGDVIVCEIDYCDGVVCVIVREIVVVVRAIVRFAADCDDCLVIV